MSLVCTTSHTTQFGKEWMRKGQNFLSNMMHFGDAKSQDKTSFQVGDISFWQNLTLSSWDSGSGHLLRQGNLRDQMDSKVEDLIFLTHGILRQ